MTLKLFLRNFLGKTTFSVDSYDYLGQLSMQYFRISWNIIVKAMLNKQRGKVN